jgi:predicted Zn-dependent peptidase
VCSSDLDLFQAVEPAPAENPVPSDDTAHLLEQGQKAVQQTEDRQIDFAVIDQINQMDKASLERFAKERFAIDLDKRKSLDKLRAEVTSYVDRVGVP